MGGGGKPCCWSWGRDPLSPSVPLEVVGEGYPQHRGLTTKSRLQSQQSSFGLLNRLKTKNSLRTLTSQRMSDPVKPALATPHHAALGPGPPELGPHGRGSSPLRAPGWGAGRSPRGPAPHRPRRGAPGTRGDQARREEVPRNC